MPVAPPNAPGSAQKTNVTYTKGWPKGTPTWQKKILIEMAKAGQLYTVPPQILAIWEPYQHNFTTMHPGINTSGYGGYFGLGVGKPYPQGTLTKTQLLTPSVTSFKNQAQILASQFAYDVTSGQAKTLALAAKVETASGAVVNTIGNFLKTVFGGKTPITGKKITTPEHPFTPGHSVASAVGSLVSPITDIAGVIGKLSDLTFWKRVGIFLAGVALFALGGIILLNSDKSVRQAEGSAVKAAALT